MRKGYVVSVVTECSGVRGLRVAGSFASQWCEQAVLGFIYALRIPLLTEKRPRVPHYRYGSERPNVVNQHF
jgi:hypothetical protein